MKLTKLLGTMEFSLTTTPTAITIPKKYNNATVLLMGALSGGEAVSWRRQAGPTSTTSKYCKAGDIGLPLNVTADYPIFYAKTVTGTGILEIEIWC